MDRPQTKEHDQEQEPQPSEQQAAVERTVETRETEVEYQQDNDK